jgi:hypothetical protein
MNVKVIYYKSCCTKNEKYKVIGNKRKTNPKEKVFNLA